MKRAYQIVSACFIAFHLCGCKNANQAQYAPQKSLAGSQNNHTDRGSAPNQKAIEAVASQFNRATMVFSNSVATLKQHPIKALFSNGLHNSFQNYKTALEQIDTQGCPVDLRITFVKYSQAVQHIIQFDNECSGLFGIGEAVDHKVNHSNKETVDEAYKPFNDEANELELIGVKYNVRFLNFTTF